MVRVRQYHETIQKLVEQYADNWKPRDGTRVEPVADPQHGHYQIVRSGWKEGRFVHCCLGQPPRVGIFVASSSGLMTIRSNRSRPTM